MRRNARKTSQPAKQKRKRDTASDRTGRTSRDEGTSSTAQHYTRDAQPEDDGHTSDEHEENVQTTHQAAASPTSHVVQRSFLRRLSDNLSFMKYVIFLLFVPPILNLSLLKQEVAFFYQRGQKVDMGWGQHMYIYCKGTGTPTVILDSPTGSNSDIWMFVQEELSQFTRACVYDRSGIGNSDAPFSDATMDRDFEHNKRFVSTPSAVNQMVNDLNYLVTKAHPLPHPLLLVGSDTAALVARMYAALHHDAVSDIVLVDPLVENLLSDSEDFTDYWYSKLLPSYEALHLSAAVGLSRIAFMLGLLHPTFFNEEVPEDVLKRQKILLCNPWHINAAFYEYRNMNLSFKQMNDIMSMNYVPQHVSISVVRRETPEEIPPDLMPAWLKSQDYLVKTLHPHTTTYTIPKKGFYEMYSSSSPLAQIIGGIISKRRDIQGIIPTMLE